MSRLLDRGMLFNALAEAHDQEKIFSIINDFPTVDVKIRPKLKDVLKTMNPTENVFIGAKEGSAFFYCSPVGMFENDKQKVNDDIIAKMQYMVEKAETYKRIVSNRIQNIKKILDDQAGTEHDKIKALKREIETLSNGIPILCTSLSRQYNYEYSLENYVPIEEREVVETYGRKQKDGTVILVEGFEFGSYWFVEEYQQGTFATPKKEETENEVS